MDNIGVDDVNTSLVAQSPVAPRASGLRGVMVKFENSKNLMLRKNE